MNVTKHFLVVAILVIFIALKSSDAIGDESSESNLLILDFELNDLTLNPDTTKEEARVKTLRPLLKEELESTYSYTIATLDQTLRDKEDKGRGYIFDRPEVSARMARAAGANWVVSGRLHKASFLFVYLKAQLINADTGNIASDFVVEIKGWQPKLTKKGVDALALQIDNSLKKISEKR